MNKVNNLTRLVFFFVGLSLIVSTQALASGKIVYSYEGTKVESARKIFIANDDLSDPVQLTSGPGTDWNPAWSPDGGKIAFSSNRDTGGRPDDYYEIFTINADGSGLIKIASMPGANCGGPQWTPDGLRIAFTVNYGSNNNSIFWINADGTNMSPLLDVHTKIGFCSFSPDGDRILFIEDGALYSTNLDGTNKTYYANAQRADWGPHPDFIVYVQLGGPRNIWKINTLTFERTQLTFDAPSDEFYLDPKWSLPDHEKIAYSRDGDLWTMNPDGTNKIRLTFDGVPGEATAELYAFPDTIQANLVIDPQTLNKKSKGNWITAYIELPAGLSASDIYPDSLRLHCLGDMFSSISTVIEGLCLIVKFDRAELIQSLVDLIGDIELKVTGKAGSIEFEGVDTIRVIK